MRRSRRERAASTALALFLLFVCSMGSRAATGGRAAGEPSASAAASGSPAERADDSESAPARGASAAPESATRPDRPPPGTVLLLLPAITGSGGGWIAPWSRPSEAARFARLDADLSARFKALGYGVMTAAEALASAPAAAVLREAPGPIAPEAGASAARALHANLVLVLRAQALRHPEGKQTSTDALVSAEVYRAADAVKLAWGNTKVSGTGADETQADAAALAQAAPALMDALAGTLLAGVQRPVVAPRPITILVEGEFRYRDYRRLIGLLQHEVPEIRELRERRYAYGRQTLRAVCACQPWDISQRLDGRTTGGFHFEVRAELDAVRLRARPVGPGGAAP